MKKFLVKLLLLLRSFLILKWFPCMIVLYNCLLHYSENNISIILAFYFIPVCRLFYVSLYKRVYVFCIYMFILYLICLICLILFVHQLRKCQTNSCWIFSPNRRVIVIPCHIKSLGHLVTITYLC